MSEQNCSTAMAVPGVLLPAALMSYLIDPDRLFLPFLNHTMYHHAVGTAEDRYQTSIWYILHTTFTCTWNWFQSKKWIYINHALDRFTHSYYYWDTDNSKYKVIAMAYVVIAVVADIYEGLIGIQPAWGEKRKAKTGNCGTRTQGVWL